MDLTSLGSIDMLIDTRVWWLCSSLHCYRSELLHQCSTFEIDRLPWVFLEKDTLLINVEQREEGQRERLWFDDRSLTEVQICRNTRSFKGFSHFLLLELNLSSSLTFPGRVLLFHCDLIEFCDGRWMGLHRYRLGLG
jgi:hypothetical protein